MKIRSAEPEGAHVPPPGIASPGGPFLCRCDDPEGDVPEIDVRVRGLKVDRGRHDLIMEREAHLDEGRGPGRGLQMADHRFYRADPYRAAFERGAVPCIQESLHLCTVSHARRGPVGLDQLYGLRPITRRLEGAPYREHLALRVRGGDPLPLSVARGADSADHGVYPVAVTPRVAHPLEYEDADPLAHDEAVGARIEWAASVGRERADLAEFHVRPRAHHEIRAPAHDHVEIAHAKTLHRLGERGKGRGARRIDRAVLPAQVEDICDPSGDHVRKLARHRVL